MTRVQFTNPSGGWSVWIICWMKYMQELKPDGYLCGVIVCMKYHANDKSLFWLIQNINMHESQEMNKAGNPRVVFVWNTWPPRARIAQFLCKGSGKHSHCATFAVQICKSSPQLTSSPLHLEIFNVFGVLAMWSLTPACISRRGTQLHVHPLVHRFILPPAKHQSDSL